MAARMREVAMTMGGMPAESQARAANVLEYVLSTLGAPPAEARYTVQYLASLGLSHNGASLLYSSLALDASMCCTRLEWCAPHKNSIAVCFQRQGCVQGRS